MTGLQVFSCLHRPDFLLYWVSPGRPPQPDPQYILGELAMSASNVTCPAAACNAVRALGFFWKQGK